MPSRKYSGALISSQELPLAVSPADVLLTLQEGGGPPLPCRVKKFLRGEVHLVSAQRVAPSTRAEARFSIGSKITGEVVGCLEAAGAYVLSFAFRHAERRREHRFPMILPGRMIDLDKNAPEIKITLCDISRNGLGITVPDFLPPGTSIVIQTPNSLIFATVRNGIQFHPGWRLGVHIDEAFLEGFNAPPPQRLVDKLSIALSRFGWHKQS